MSFFYIKFFFPLTNLYNYVVMSGVVKQSATRIEPKLLEEPQPGRKMAEGGEIVNRKKIVIFNAYNFEE